MDGFIEHEVCGNCKREIPQQNYVMHTAHCSRNITLCQVCKEPIPKSEFDKHKKNCVAVKPKIKKSELLSTNSERHKETVTKRIAVKKTEKLADTRHLSKDSDIKTQKRLEKNKESGLVACRFCDLELPKLDLQEHENYCGTRTDKCLECGELVMFKYKQIHLDSNHGFLKLNDEPGPRASWDSTIQRSTISETSTSRLRPLRSLSNFSATSNLFPTCQTPEKSESLKEISRRFDCKTEYIRNLLHNSASITAPLRQNGAIPRNHFNHKKGRAPLPPQKNSNPPTEVTIPCEFCGVPVPHENLIQHETSCGPDVAKLNSKAKSSIENDYFVAPPARSAEEELPCEFCADMIPASQLLSHQAICF